MLFYKIKRVLSLKFTEKVYHLEAITWLLLSKVCVLLFPIKYIYKYLGEMNRKVISQLSDVDLYKANLVRTSILRLGRHVPWKSVCLDQAIATGVMLKVRNIPYTLCFGLKTNDTEGKLAAHAWIECGTGILVGGKESLNFNIILSFGNDKRKKH